MEERIDPSDFSASELALLEADASEFVLASTNVDEDLHFSSLYFETTLAAPRLLGIHDDWYSELVAVNTQAVEKYFLRAAECQRVSSMLSDLVLENPDVLASLLAETERRAGVLDAAFPFGWLAADGPRYRRDELIELYRRHHALHRYLYEVARVPEALDRGTGEFTTRLRQIVAGRARELDGDLFRTLTTVGRPSVFREEQEAFATLADELNDHERHAVTEARSDGLALMALTPRSLERLKTHRRTWGPLFYHGYANRDPVQLATLAWRLRQVLVADRDRVLPQVPTADERERLISELGLLPEQAAAFHMYGMLGWTKARRRWIQLRNFQRLDRLLELIAEELDCAEWDLRVLLPSELIAWLEGGRRPEAIIEGRYHGALLWYRSGAALRAARLPERFPFESGSVSPVIELTGERVVPGTVRGRCRIVTRSQVPSKFDGGEPLILVVAQLDSDLVWTLPFYDGLIVEERGASAHVAIIAREIGIPTIAGVHDATAHLVEGEWIALNATEGRVRREESLA